MSTVDFVRAEMARLVGTLRLPPFDELRPETIAERLDRQTQFPTHSPHGELRLLVESHADEAWKRLTRMLTGRARVQLCLMGIPERLETAEDVAQAVLARARESHDQFQGVTEAEYRGWVKTILNNLLIDRGRALRKGQRGALRTISVDEQCERLSTQNGLPIADHRQVTGSEAARRSEAADLLFEAMEKLSRDERQIVSEKLAERTFDEIARDTGLPKTTVVRRYHAALAALRQQLRGLE